MEAKTITLILFLITYACLLIYSKAKAYIAIGCALIFAILGQIGLLPVYNYLAAIDWNVIMMIAGTMGVVSLFIESKMPSKLADFIIDRVPNVKWAMVSLALFAGVISAFVDNVATVIMVAPVALNISKKLRISPIPSIITIAVSSNLQGVATLVGDTTSILLGGEANMNFLDFFFYKGRPGIFWVVEAGALATVFILLWLFKKYKHPIKSMNKTVVKDYFPTVLLVGIVVLLTAASFIGNKPAITNGLICVGLMVVGLIRKFIKTRDKNTLADALREIDYTTLSLLAGLFIVIGGIKEVGIIEDIGAFFVYAGKGNLFVIYSLILWASVAISAVIDNIPYVATMLPVTTAIAATMGIDPTILYFGLLVGATLGGNITPIGASANIAGIGILRKAGYDVEAKDFMRISVPFTLTAVATGYILVWLIWA